MRINSFVFTTGMLLASAAALPNPIAQGDNVSQRDRPTYLGNGVYSNQGQGQGNQQPGQFYPFPVQMPQNPATPCPACPAQTPCPVCPAGPVACTANNSVINPGFEANGGSLQPWTVSDPTVVTIDSANGVQDPQGLHSAQFTLNVNMVTGWINQNVTVCPGKSYKVYFAVKLLPMSSAPAGVLPGDQGRFNDKSQCNIFVSLGGSGSSTVTGAALQYGQYNTITTNQAYTVGANSTSSNLMISAVCSAAAFGTTAGQDGYLYFDNINLLPQGN